MDRIKAPCLLLLALASGALAAPPPAAHGHGAAPAARNLQAELGAQAAVDARGGLWAVHKVSGHLAVSRSEDRGRTWSNPVLVTASPEATDPGADARPKIVVGPGGEVYVSWTRPLARPYTGEIRFARSLDGGRTFSTPTVVHRDRQEITHRFDSLAVDRRGHVFIAWIDKRDLVAAAAAKGPAYRGAAVYFAVSEDRGTSFRGDTRLADHSCECCRIALVPQREGGLTAMWRHVFEPNIRDHALARIGADGRPGPVERVTFEDWRIDACPHHGPALAEDGRGRLHAVWFSAAPGNAGLSYGRLGDGRVEAGRRVGGEAAAHADIQAEGDRVFIAWKEFDGERTRLRALRSEDAGTRWREFDLAATNGASDHPQLLLVGGEATVFWPTEDQPLSVTPIPQ